MLVIIVIRLLSDPSVKRFSSAFIMIDTRDVDVITSSSAMYKSALVIKFSSSCGGIAFFAENPSFASGAKVSKERNGPQRMTIMLSSWVDRLTSRTLSKVSYITKLLSS